MVRWVPLSMAAVALLLTMPALASAHGGTPVESLLGDLTLGPAGIPLGPFLWSAVRDRRRRKP